MEKLFKRYIGTKVIDAFPMTLGDYNEYKGWKIPANEDPDTEGYLVKYPDGYKSWSPKEAFEEAYREIEIGCMNFGMAIEALKKGFCVARKGWNGKGMFVMKQIPAKIGLDTIPKMQSVQSSAKTILISRQTELNYQNQMLLIKPDGTADSWIASSSDTFADDWFIVL